MAKTITYPPRVVMAGNEVLISAVDTDAYVSRGLSTNGAIYLATFHNVGDTIAFAWNSKTLTFTCVASYIGTLGTYPVRTTETIQEWGAIVFEILASHYMLADDFIVSGEVDTSRYIIHFEPIEKYSWNNLNITCAASTVIDSNYTENELYENYKMKLQLMLKTLAGDITTMEKYRSAVYIPFAYDDLDASLQYDISRLIYDDATGHFTFPESGLHHLQNIIKQLYIFLSFIADNIDSSSLPVDNYFYVLPGKMPNNKVKALNTAGTSLYAQLISEKNFLSEAPLIKTTDIYAPEKLYFIFSNYAGTANLMIKEYYTDDTTETRTLVSFNFDSYTLYEFAVGFQSIKKSDYAGKVPEKYEIYVARPWGGTVLSERRTFVLDYTYQRMARYFLFKNSWGVYELLRTTGDAKKTNSIEKEFYSRKILGMVDTDQLRKPADVKQAFSAEINTGHLEAPWNVYFATEFLASEDVYWLKNDRAYAIQIESSDPDFSGSDLINQHNFDFKVTADDIDDSFYTDYGPESELPVLGDFNGDFSDDYNR